MPPAADELLALGMPFPLYKGPLASLSALVENARCTACGETRSHLFELTDSNDHVVVPCVGCREPVTLLAGWRDEVPPSSTCPRCSAVNGWTDDRPRDGAAVCYECLRSGQAALAHETELGCIDLPHARRGLTWHAQRDAARRTGLATAVLETFPDGSQSIGIHVPKDPLLELLRTPRHACLQSEYWPWHCGGFMAFLGRWQQEDFERQRPGRGREWFGEHMDPKEPWEDMWSWLEGDIGWSYVYRCSACGLHRVFVDSD